MPFSEVISTRKVRAGEGATLYLELKCGNLFQQRVARLQTDQAHEIARLVRQYITMHRRELLKKWFERSLLESKIMFVPVYNCEFVLVLSFISGYSTLVDRPRLPMQTLVSRDKCRGFKIEICFAKTVWL